MVKTLIYSREINFPIKGLTLTRKTLSRRFGYLFCLPLFFSISRRCRNKMPFIRSWKITLFVPKTCIILLPLSERWYLFLSDMGLDKGKVWFVFYSCFFYLRGPLAVYLDANPIRRPTCGPGVIGTPSHLLRFVLALSGFLMPIFFMGAHCPCWNTALLDLAGRFDSI